MNAFFTFFSNRLLEPLHVWIKLYGWQCVSQVTNQLKLPSIPKFNHFCLFHIQLFIYVIIRK